MKGAAETKGEENRGRRSRLAALGDFLGLPGALASNPVFARQVGVSLNPTRFAAVLFVVNLALLIATLSAVKAVAGRGSQPGGTAGFGSYLAAINSCVTYGLLALFLPLRVSGLFESARFDRAFDQVVVTGVSPARLHLGNWAAAMAFAGVLILATLPYQAFAYQCRGVSAAVIARDAALLLAYANVMVLLSMALGVALNELAATPLSVVLFLVLGGLGLAPVPSAIGHLTPVRFFMQRGFKESFQSGADRFLYGPPVLFFWTPPDWAVVAALWSLVLLGALIYLSLGPSHTFSPGLNNFGQVVLPGDRKRSRLRTLRFHWNRRVEMAFLYQNRSRAWDPWDWPLRAWLLLSLTGAWWVAMLGWAFNPQVTKFRDLLQGGMQVYVLVMAGLGLLFALVFYGESRERIYLRGRLGPLRLSRGLLALLYFLFALGSFFAVAYLPLARLLGSEIAAQAPGSEELAGLQGHLAALPERVEILGLFAVTLFLLGRLLARAARTPMAARALLVLVALVLFCGPMLLVPLYEERVIAWPGPAHAVSISPLPALIESFRPEDHLFQMLKVGRTGPLFFKIHVGIILLLSLWILALNLRRWSGARRKTPRPAAARTAAGALPILLLGGGTLLSLPAGAAEIEAEVVRDFGGHAFTAGEHFTVILSRGGPTLGETAGSSAVELSLEEIDGRVRALPTRVEVPPSTRTVVRLVAVPGESMGPQHRLKLILRSGEGRREVAVPEAVHENGDSLRILSVNDEGKVPSLVLPGHRWVRSLPLWLPERPEGYRSIDLVLVGPTDLGSWTAAQRRALYDFVRLGGSVVFFGPIDDRSLAGSGEWADLLSPLEPPRTESSGIPFRIHRLKGARVVWSEREGAQELPVLSLRRLGPGSIGYLSVDPLNPRTPERFGGPERFWGRFAAAAPLCSFAGGPLVRFQFPAAAAGGGSLLIVLVYFLIYTVALGPLLYFLLRSRRRRGWVWAYAPAASLLFIAGAPLLFTAMEASPSLALEASVTFEGEEGGEGVRHTLLTVASSGRQDHRLAFLGKDLTVLGWSGARGAGSVFAQGYLEPLGSVKGPGPLEMARFRVLPWGRRRVLAISSTPHPPTWDHVGGRAWAVKSAGKPPHWQVEVEGLPPDKPAAVLVFLSTVVDSGPSTISPFPALTTDGEEPMETGVFLSDSLPPRAGRPSRSATLKGGRLLRQLSGAALRRGPAVPPIRFSLSRIGRPRAFVIWEEEPPAAAVASRDLSFEEEPGRLGYIMKEIEVVEPPTEPEQNEEH